MSATIKAYGNSITISRLQELLRKEFGIRVKDRVGGKDGRVFLLIRIK